MDDKIWGKSLLGSVMWGNLTDAHLNQVIKLIGNNGTKCIMRP